MSTAKAGKVQIGGNTASSAHTVNSDELAEFTRHINNVRSHVFYLVSILRSS